MTLFETITEFVGIEAPSLMEIIFVSCAVLGGILFFIMMLLMMVFRRFSAQTQRQNFQAMSLMYLLSLFIRY